MTTKIEMLVSAHAAASVQARLGRATWSRVTTSPSRASAARLVVDCLDTLDTPAARLDLERTWKQASALARPVPVVLLTCAEGNTPLPGAVLQTLLHMSHIAESEPYVAPGPDAVRRMVLARQSHAEDQLIASAILEDDKLVVWSCEPKRYEVDASEITALARMSSQARADFEVTSSGSRIHWRSADVDLNLDAIRAHGDPAVRREHDVMRRREAARYADAIRRLREERGLQQSEIEGLSERHVRRLEGGETIPHSSTLKKLAAAHEMSVDGYLAELATRSRARPTESGRRSARGRATVDRSRPRR
jgi:ribosome-binding protein aMBF1 (putative translation factor)